MRKLTPLAVATLLVLAPPRTLGAQAERPPVRSTRFDEAWPTRDSTWDHWSDRLKHIALSPNGQAWVTFAGSARAREESVRNLGFSDAPAMRDAFGLLRVQGSADLHVESRRGPFARAFAELRDASAYGRTLPGGLRPTDADRHDWENAFVEFGSARRGSTSAALRWGRQDVILGRERLVGLADWNNSRRAFEGARVQGRAGGLAFDLLDAHVVTVRSREPNRPDPAARLRYLAAGSAADAVRPAILQPSTWQVYAIRFDATVAAHRRATYGTRMEWKRAPGGPAGLRTTLEFEGAVQRGTLAARDIAAWFAATEVRFGFTRIRTSPTLILGFDRASGERRDSAATTRAFTALYATGHQYEGIADAFGRANLSERRVGLVSDIAKSAQLSWVLRGFARVERTDGLYSKANARVIAPGASPAMSVGHEQDLTLVWRVGRHLRVDGGVAWVSPGAYLRETIPTARQQRFAFAATSITF